MTAITFEDILLEIKSNGGGFAERLSLSKSSQTSQNCENIDI